jgi:transcriptional regulator with PAS, ATPase and Fis domain
MPEQLVESELFGYKKGSFTGAVADKQGLVSMADGGTLFLDELAELTLPMQVKLLRLVQEKKFRPVGGGAELTADLRFIAATNKNLETEIMAGRFREDLYYRLNVINIHLPALRERVIDIPLLAHYFLEKYSLAQGKDVRKLSTYALDILQRYHFPGNVRELENIIERSVALEQSNIILPESLRLADFKRDSSGANGPAGLTPKDDFPAPAEPLAAPEAGPAPGPEAASPAFPPLPPGGLDDVLTALEIYYIFNALVVADGRRGLTAKLLNISPWRLRARLIFLDLNDIDPKSLAAMPAGRYPKPPLPSGLAPDWTGSNVNLYGIIQKVELHYIHLAMKQSRDNKTEAAMILGLTLRSFKHRLERSNYEREAAKLAILEGNRPQ